MTVDQKPFAGPRDQADVQRDHLQRLREVTGESHNTASQVSQHQPLGGTQA